MTRVLVCPVAFNEHLKVQQTMARFLASSAAGKADCLVVDDGSTDETTGIISSFAPRGIKTIKHACRRGVGAAIRTAVTYARNNGYEVLVIMAGNNKDDSDQINDLVAPIIKGGYDFVQGSRYLGQGKIGGDMPLYRKWATRLHPFLMSLFTGCKVTDSTNGFRAIRTAIFDDKRINLDQDWLDHYELEPYLLFKVLTLGFRYREVPVTKIYPDKKLGYTKMKPLIGWWSILKPIFYLGFRIKK